MLANIIYTAMKPSYLDNQMNESFSTVGLWNLFNEAPK